jgi:hypothetical protein
MRVAPTRPGARATAASSAFAENVKLRRESMAASTARGNGAQADGVMVVDGQRRSFPFPSCRAAGRTFGDCEALAGDEAACNATYELGGGATETCWYDAGVCAGCSTLAQADGLCTNGC